MSGSVELINHKQSSNKAIDEVVIAEESGDCRKEAVCPNSRPVNVKTRNGMMTLKNHIDEKKNNGIMNREIRNGMLSTINCGMRSRAMRFGDLKIYMNQKSRLISMSFVKRLYLDHVISFDGLEHAVFGRRINMRKAMAKAQMDEYGTLSNCQKAAEISHADKMSYNECDGSTERKYPSDYYDRNDYIKRYDNQNDEAVVLIEVPLNVVMKMDTMMEGLLETMRRWGKLDGADET
ncbi:1241_t:CDS:2, partial [Gigaspora rosea]